MNLFLGLANLSTTGLLLASSGQVADVSNQVQVQPPPKPEKSTTVTVKRGDYLSKIAKRYDTTWRRIYDANRVVKHPDIIKPGDKLRIPEDEEKLKHRPLPENRKSPVAKTVSRTTATVNNYSAQHPRTTYRPVSSGSVWDRLARCESGGNWSINTGNGYYGGLQFSLSTWRGVGGSGYPHQASREEQIARAEILLDRAGWGSWPACSSKLGLR